MWFNLQHSIIMHLKLLDLLMIYGWKGGQNSHQEVRTRTIRGSIPVRRICAALLKTWRTWTSFQFPLWNRFGLAFNCSKHTIFTINWPVLITKRSVHRYCNETLERIALNDPAHIQVNHKSVIQTCVCVEVWPGCSRWDLQIVAEELMLSFSVFLCHDSPKPVSSTLRAWIVQ